MAPAATEVVELTPAELEVAGEELRTKFFAELEENKELAEEYCEADLQRLRDDSWYCQRFVLHEKGDMEKAGLMVKEAFKWRKEFNVHDIKESNLLAEFFEAQGVYPYNTDKDGNPVLMLVVKLHRKDAEIQPELRRFLIYWIEKLERENNDKKMTVLFDCSGAGLSNLDLDMIRFLVTTFRNYYPHLLAQIVVYDMPWLFNAAWRIIKTWLAQDAVEKIKFVTKKSIFEYVDKENLPVSMGGLCTYNGQKEIEDYRQSLQKQFQLINYTNRPQVDKNIDEKKTLNNKYNLELSPSEKLEFPHGSEFEKATALLTLKNVSSQSLGYKIRGNNIEAYKVRPFTGFLEPGAAQLITIDLVDSQPCQPKDKFLVQAVPVDNKNINIHKFNALWRAAPKLLKEEHMLECCKAVKVSPPKKVPSPQDDSPNQVARERQTSRKLAELSRSVRALQRQNTVLRLCLLTLSLALLPVVWLLYEVVDLLRVQPGGLCDRTIRDSVLATVLCKSDRTILPSHMM